MSNKLEPVAVELAWNDVARTWWVVRSDITGLTAEAPTVEALLKEIPHRVPALLASEPIPYEGQNVTLRVTIDVVVENPLLGG